MSKLAVDTLFNTLIQSKINELRTQDCYLGDITDEELRHFYGAYKQQFRQFVGNTDFLLDEADIESVKGLGIELIEGPEVIVKLEEVVKGFGILHIQSAEVLAKIQKADKKQFEDLMYALFVKSLERLIQEQWKVLLNEEKPTQGDPCGNAAKLESAYIMFSTFMRSVDQLEILDKIFEHENCQPNIDQSLKSRFQQGMKEEKFLDEFRRSWEARLPRVVKDMSNVFAVDTRRTRHLVASLIPWSEHYSGSTVADDLVERNSETNSIVYVQSPPAKVEEDLDFLLEPRWISAQTAVDYLQNVFTHYAREVGVEAPKVVIFGKDLPGNRKLNLSNVRDQNLELVEVKLASKDSKQKIIRKLSEECYRPNVEGSLHPRFTVKPDSFVGVEQRKFLNKPNEQKTLAELKGLSPAQLQIVRDKVKLLQSQATQPTLNGSSSEPASSKTLTPSTNSLSSHMSSASQAFSSIPRSTSAQRTAMSSALTWQQHTTAEKGSGSAVKVEKNTGSSLGKDITP